MGDFVFYFGTECHFCHDMDPLLKKLEKELKIKVEKKEVWHNSKNNQEFKKNDNGQCGGVPFLYNKKTKKGLCGSVPYQELKKWVQGK